MSVETWRKVKLDDVIQFNPTESIKKNTVAKKVAMEKLTPFKKVINGFELTEFTGGAKFRNGDTLLARITPCLENGKTAQVNILEDGEVGFGSTEFIVLREKVNITCNDYIYYLAISQDFRNKAIQSMTGTSGRQRVQTDLLQNVEIFLPSLTEQKAIASVLATLDNKIDINNQINKKLEEIAQAVFKSWFIEFEPFRDGEFEDSDFGMIPKGWYVQTLGDCVVSIDNRGKTPPLATSKTEYPIIDVKALSGESRIIDYNNCTKYVDEEVYNTWFRSGHPKQNDILISTVGSLAEIKLFFGNKGCIAQNVVGFRSKGISPTYIYQYLQYIKSDLIAYDIGSVQPSIKVTHVLKHKVLIPPVDVLFSFDSIIKCISDKIFKTYQETQTLTGIRDTVLPKLISGEIGVSEDFQQWLNLLECQLQA